METVQWPQEIGLVRATEETAAMGAATGGSSAGGKAPEMTGVERRIGGRPQKEQALNCPRCNSNNTKFCYYNNYSLSQPRYFCKTCRRYWTEGGSLRNVPVGGGSRKNKRSSSAASAATTRPRLASSSIESEGRYLNLGFHHPSGFPPELIGGDFAPVPAPQVVYPAGFVLQDFRSFQLDGGIRAVGEGGEGRFLFPSGDDQNRGHGGETGFWNGMMGGEGSW